MSKFFATAVIAVVLTVPSARVGHAQRLSLDLVGGVSTSTLHVEGAPGKVCGKVSRQTDAKEC